MPKLPWASFLWLVPTLLTGSGCRFATSVSPASVARGPAVGAPSVQAETAPPGQAQVEIAEITPRRIRASVPATASPGIALSLLAADPAADPSLEPSHLRSEDPSHPSQRHRSRRARERSRRNRRSVTPAPLPQLPDSEQPLQPSPQAQEQLGPEQPARESAPDQEKPAPERQPSEQAPAAPGPAPSASTAPAPASKEQPAKPDQQPAPVTPEQEQGKQAD